MWTDVFFSSSSEQGLECGCHDHAHDWGGTMGEVYSMNAHDDDLHDFENDRREYWADASSGDDITGTQTRTPV